MPSSSAVPGSPKAVHRFAILVEGDRGLTETVHAMRSFRSPHPAGKMFVAWIAGRRGRAVVAAQRGYRIPAP
jgi:hypothetical protein